MRLVVPSRDVLGEGPCWVPAEGRLYWFDIQGRCLNWHHPDSGASGVIDLPMRSSAAASRTRGGLIMATEAGLATFEPRSERVDVIEPIVLPPGFRTNDGKIDPQGRFWWSIMDDDGGRRPGAIFLTTPDCTTRVLEGIHIANTVCITADGATLYLADSKQQTIFAYDLPGLTRRVFASTDGDTAPDGSALDVEGFLWNAQWGGARLVRYAPDGAIDRIVRTPVRQPTSCAFGGPELTTLYVTSAREGLSTEQLAGEPDAGGLFAFEPGVAGLPFPSFKG
jgi:sugar lactone lactonase YvrE